MKIINRLLTALFIAGIIMGTEFPLIAVAADYTTTYTYDDLGRPISVNVGGSTADFAYDAAGNRIVVSLSPGSTAPSVVVVSPPADATGVSPDITIAATFSRPVDPTTVTTGISGTFRLTGPDAAIVAGTVSVHGLEAAFVPNSSLQNNTLYTATVTTGIKDLFGTVLAPQAVWSFTIGAAPDLTLPTVLSITPLSGAVNVPLTSVITALFSEAIDPATVNSTSFLVKNGAATVSANVDYTVSTRIAKLTPQSLDPDVTYTVVLLSSITDLSGNRLAANKEWSFTTETTGTPVLPVAETLIPYIGQTDLPLRTSVGVIFNKAMDPNTINNSTFTVEKGAVVVAGAVSYNSIKHQATFIPTVPFDPGTVYIVTLTTEIKDTAARPLSSPVTWSFTTVPLPPFLVTCNLSGYGSGIIESTPASNACGAGSCSGNFDQKSTVLLHPVPDDTSQFSGWGAPCTGTGDCSFTVNANTILTATFDLKPVRIAGEPPQYFTTLQAAYNGTAANDVIQAKAAVFVEGLTADVARVVTIRGGYDAAYATVGGYVALKGKLTIKAGKIIANRLVIK